MAPSEKAPQRVVDPFLEEVRGLKEAVSIQFGHDVVKLCEALRREQASSGRRLIRRKRNLRSGAEGR